MKIDKEKFFKLESKLLKPEVRKSYKEFDEMLHIDFIEYCSSGRVVDKELVINHLPETRPVKMEIEAFKAELIGDSTVLTRFRLKKVDKKTDKISYSLRSSIWKKINQKQKCG